MASGQEHAAAEVADGLDGAVTCGIAPEAAPEAAPVVAPGSAPVHGTVLPADPVTSPDVEVAVETPSVEEALGLYGAVGWSAYTRDPATLGRALAGSAVVVTARRQGELVGLARVVGDGASIAYLQDVLVHPGARRRGLGRLLIDAAFAPFDDVRQQVLLTDAEPGQRAFYEALGFTEAHDHEPGLRAFVRLR